MDNRIAVWMFLVVGIINLVVSLVNPSLWWPNRQYFHISMNILVGFIWVGVCLYYLFLKAK
jgi:hypothetical protein